MVNTTPTERDQALTEILQLALALRARAPIAASTLMAGADANRAVIRDHLGTEIPVHPMTPEDAQLQELDRTLGWAIAHLRAAITQVEHHVPELTRNATGHGIQLHGTELITCACGQEFTGPGAVRSWLDHLPLA